jgi:hypothetical protein
MIAAYEAKVRSLMNDVNDLKGQGEGGERARGGGVKGTVFTRLREDLDFGVAGGEVLKERRSPRERGRMGTSHDGDDDGDGGDYFSFRPPASAAAEDAAAVDTPSAAIDRFEATVYHPSPPKREREETIGGRSVDVFSDDAPRAMDRDDDDDEDVVVTRERDDEDDDDDDDDDDDGGGSTPAEVKFAREFPEFTRAAAAAAAATTTACDDDDDAWATAFMLPKASAEDTERQPSRPGGAEGERRQREPAREPEREPVEPPSERVKNAKAAAIAKAAEGVVFASDRAKIFAAERAASREKAAAARERAAEGKENDDGNENAKKTRDDGRTCRGGGTPLDALLARQLARGRTNANAAAADAADATNSISEQGHARRARLNRRRT